MQKEILQKKKIMRDDPFKDQMITHKRRYYNENRKQYAPRTLYLKRTVGT